MKKLWMIALLFAAKAAAMQNSFEDDMKDLVTKFEGLKTQKTQLFNAGKLGESFDTVTDHLGNCDTHIVQMQLLWDAQKPQTFKDIMSLLTKKDDDGCLIKEADEIDITINMSSIGSYGKEDETEEQKTERLKKLVQQYATTRKQQALELIAVLDSLFKNK